MGTKVSKVGIGYSSCSFMQESDTAGRDCRFHAYWKSIYTLIPTMNVKTLERANGRQAEMAGKGLSVSLLSFCIADFRKTK